VVNPKLTWGVWIEGQGWLKREATGKAGETAGDRTFASESKIVAEGAAELWGQGATVRPIDGSLIDLEAVFIERRKPKGAGPTWWGRFSQWYGDLSLRIMGIEPDRRFRG